MDLLPPHGMVRRRPVGANTLTGFSVSDDVYTVVAPRQYSDVDPVNGGVHHFAKLVAELVTEPLYGLVAKVPEVTRPIGLARLEVPRLLQPLTFRASLLRVMNFTEAGFGFQWVYGRYHKDETQRRWWASLGGQCTTAAIASASAVALTAATQPGSLVHAHQVLPLQISPSAPPPCARLEPPEWLVGHDVGMLAVKSECWSQSWCQLALSAQSQLTGCLLDARRKLCFMDRARHVDIQIAFAKEPP